MPWLRFGATQQQWRILHEHGRPNAAVRRGPSTHLDQTALGKIQTGLVPEDLTICDADRTVLRRLASAPAVALEKEKYAPASRDRMAVAKRVFELVGGR